MTTKICLVTNELYPVAPGGIGRLIYNFITTNKISPKPSELHVLFLGDAVTAGRLASELVGAARVHAFSVEDMHRLLGRRGVNVDWRDGCTRRYMESLAIHDWFVAQEQRKLRFDVVEFPDVHGWAAATLSAKKMGHGFEQTRVAVRLHSTNGILTYFEPHYHEPSLELLFAYDLERFCLAAADVVVGHLRAIRDFNGDFYAMNQNWYSRTVLEKPPILLTEEEREASATDEVPESIRRCIDSGHPLFVFSQRLQPFKRPDTFIDAAILCARQMPPDADNGMYVVMSYGWDQNYIAELKRKIPRDLADRIVFLDHVSTSTRAFVLGNGVVVFPSVYESLCLAAIECVQRGRPVILNEGCIGFSRNPWFHRSENVYYYDGSASGLARVMRTLADDAQRRQPAAERAWTRDRPYWEAHQSADSSQQALRAAVRVRAVIWAGDSPATDRLAIEAILAADVPSMKIDVVETEPSYRLQQWVRSLDRLGVRVFRLSGLQRTEALRVVLSDSEDAYVLIVPPGYVPNPEFVRQAVKALGRDPEIASVCGPLLRYSSLEDLDARRGATLVPRAGASLAGAMLFDEPLAASLIKVEALLGLLPRTFATREALRDVHAALIASGRLVIEDTVPAASIIGVEDTASGIDARRRSGLLRMFCDQSLFRAALAR